MQNLEELTISFLNSITLFFQKYSSYRKKEYPLVKGQSIVPEIVADAEI